MTVWWRRKGWHGVGVRPEIKQAVFQNQQSLAYSRKLRIIILNKKMPATFHLEVNVVMQRGVKNVYKKSGGWHREQIR